MGEKYCISGGALGADLKWANEAKKYDFKPIHYSFVGHKTNAPEQELVRLDQAKLRLGNQVLLETSKRIGRRWPPRHDYTKKLLQRNYWQVRNTQAVYAVSTIDANGVVAGGTAWAVHAFIVMRVPGIVAPCFVFDQQLNRWFQWDGTRWQLIDRPLPPADVFTGIGSRDLLPAGERAIEQVFLT